MRTKLKTEATLFPGGKELHTRRQAAEADQMRHTSAIQKAVLASAWVLVSDRWSRTGHTQVAHRSHTGQVQDAHRYLCLHKRNMKVSQSGLHNECL